MTKKTGQWWRENHGQATICVIKLPCLRVKYCSAGLYNLIYVLNATTFLHHLHLSIFKSTSSVGLKRANEWWVYIYRVNLYLLQSWFHIYTLSCSVFVFVSLLHELIVFSFCICFSPAWISAPGLSAVSPGPHLHCLNPGTYTTMINTSCSSLMVLLLKRIKSCMYTRQLHFAWL